MHKDCANMEICHGCKEEIDPEMCWCGQLIKYHNGYEGHIIVLMGCICHYPTTKKRNILNKVKTNA